MHPLKPVYLPFFVLVVLGLAACRPVTQSTAADETSKVVQLAVSTDQIQAIQTPANQGKTVHLRGKVGNQVPLLEGLIYELQDSTGKIWVVTKGAVPNQGDEVVIRGVLRYQSIPLNGKEQGSTYVEQQEQLQLIPAIKS